MPTPRRRQSGPDRARALDQYHRRAAVYDFELALFEPVRRRAVAWLAPERGATVLDIGCGTGLSFELLHSAVGAQGHVVGIEQSPQMLEQARQRVQRHAWRNVTLINAPAEEARIGLRADAALLHFTHDVMQSGAALEHVLRHLQPGATLVASGLKWAPPWAAPLNLLVWPAALHSVSSLAGLRRPWQHLARLVGEPELQTMLGGTVYLARARVPAAGWPA
ncbi:MAG TPA: methyltransferase domain-containing protein [Rubrivivax sp.]|nr:methyltransferase domain-containing protein [Rubrivivax sp.]